jgi:hypothetical protein
MSATSLEIKQPMELALAKDGQSAEDDEILDVSAFLVRIKGMKGPALTTLPPFTATAALSPCEGAYCAAPPLSLIHTHASQQYPSTGPQGRMVHPDAQSSISLGPATDNNFATQVSFVQVESGVGVSMSYL